MNMNQLLSLWRQKVLLEDYIVQLTSALEGFIPRCVHKVLETDFILGMNVTDIAALLSPSAFGTSSSVSTLGQEHPLPSVLKRLYTETTTHAHLIFIFRHSSDAANHYDREHVSDALQTASHIHTSGIAKVASMSMICARQMKGCFLPSFAHEVETELELVENSLVPGSRSASSLAGLMQQASRAAEFTMRIKTQIVDAIMKGRRPVLISMGANALSHNWERFSLFHGLFEDAYGSLDMWLRLSPEEARGQRSEVSRVMCPLPIDEGIFGRYTLTDIAAHERDVKYNAGVAVWKVLLSAMHDRNKDTSHSCPPSSTLAKSNLQTKSLSSVNLIREIRMKTIWWNSVCSSSRLLLPSTTPMSSKCVPDST